MSYFGKINGMTLPRGDGLIPPAKIRISQTRASGSPGNGNDIGSQISSLTLLLSRFSSLPPFLPFLILSILTPFFPLLTMFIIQSIIIFSIVFTHLSINFPLYSFNKSTVSNYTTFQPQSTQLQFQSVQMLSPVRLFVTP